MDRWFSPRGTIMAKDELIWLHAEQAALLPHVFDVIESLVFAKAIVPPFSPPAENSGLLSYREKLIFSFAEAILHRANPMWAIEKNKSDRALGFGFRSSARAIRASSTGLHWK